VAWYPIPELNRTDGDVNIFFLHQNSLAYLEPVFDPFFSANGTYMLPGLPYARPDRVVNVMICVDQYRFCNPANNTCTPYDGWRGHTQAINGLGLNVKQFASFVRLDNIVSAASTYTSVAGLGAGGKAFVPG
jgi:hypothetical protein